ncbi:MAG: hypothetical protein M3Q27_16200, partial [Actinomycetota bacterium]|nr:hypothetical protein [Actinomycetota bacterium]
AMVSRLRRVDADDVRRLAAAAERTRVVGGGTWARAVHDASWAVYLSGRVRPAASAQLLAVQAVSAAGVPVSELAGGTWNLVSGAVHAVAVRDVVDEAVLDGLLRPWVEALGPSTS